MMSLANFRMFAGRLLLVASSGMLCLICADVFLQVFRPYNLDMQARIWTPPLAGSPTEDRFTMDEEFGFRPTFGNGVYTEYGTLVNSYALEKSAGMTRLLFIGDSATARGRIVEALKGEYGTNSFEYWNAGVESFSTPQEVRYYERYNARIKPDHVILTFHNNDFQTTPIAFRDKSGKITLYTPQMAGGEINPWLLRHSDLYRRYVARSWSGSRKHESIVGEIKANLRQLRDRLTADGVGFGVLVLPILAPYETWTDEERRSRDDALRILTELGIRSFDLRPVLDAAVTKGTQLCDTPGDKWHPGADIAREFAQTLRADNILATEPRP